MSLVAGTRLGPYEIQAAIGAGGIGEVYKARDTRLDRTVAIKVLPTELSADHERRARFEREAKTIAGLTHPHICTLFGVGEHNGSTYLVMEYLAGESLAERLHRGRPPLDQALSVATDIADALTAAHKQGIIHRDLKPGNVMLTKAGAKLLDFGLAKLRGHGERPAAADAMSLPTQPAPLTAAGQIVGTLQYMAPEQLEGKPADARTDLWALGTILYEMVAGRLVQAKPAAAKIRADPGFRQIVDRTHIRRRVLRVGERLRPWRSPDRDREHEREPRAATAARLRPQAWRAIGVCREGTMATIAYSLTGEGRGHATRVLAMVEQLRKRHRIILYASRDGFELLSKAYAGSEVGVRRIPGLYYIYDSTGRTQNVMTALCALGFLCKLNGRARSLAAQLDRERVDLVISDFETIVTRAAESSRIPYIIFDHQHFLLTYDLRCLPLKLRLQAFTMKCAISIVSGRKPVHTIVSSFFFPPLLSGLNNVTQIGTLVHPEIVSAQVSDEGHVVAYFRRTLTPRCYQSLRHCGVDVHLYGLGEKARDGNIFYRPTDVHRFVESLAASRALVCSAGNQIIGEAFYLKKPVLAVPEPNNMEQRINGFFLGTSRAGMCVLDHQIESSHVRNIVENVETFRHDADSRNIDGTSTALRIVESCLSPAARRSHAKSGSGTAPAPVNPGRETGS